MGSNPTAGAKNLIEVRAMNYVPITTIDVNKLKEPLPQRVRVIASNGKAYEGQLISQTKERIIVKQDDSVKVKIRC